MALSYDFIIARAEHEAREAAGARLDNVRERALRSEAAWRTMAEKLLEAARSRELADQERRAAAGLCDAPQ